MLKRFFNFFKEIDRRIRITISAIGLHQFNRYLTQQYNELYTVGLGANSVELGTLTSIGELFKALFLLPVGWIADKYGIKKAISIGLALAIFVSAFYAFAGNWLGLIPAVILARIEMEMTLPFADIIVINYTKQKLRATIMGVTRTIWNILPVFTPIIAAVIVTRFGGINVQGIRPLYYIQFVLASILFLVIVLKLKTPAIRPSELSKSGSKKFSFIQDIKEVLRGEKWLKRWTVVWVVRQFSTRISMPFIPLWKVHVKGASPYILGIASTLSIVMNSLLSIPAGKLSDKVNRKRAYTLIRPAWFLSIILLIIAPFPELLILVGLLEGISMAGQIPFIMMTWEIAPAEKRGRWKGIRGIFSVFNFPATIIGGILWQQGFMIYVLLIPLIIELLIVIPMILSVPDRRLL